MALVSESLGVPRAVAVRVCLASVWPPLAREVVQHLECFVAVAGAAGVRAVEPPGCWLWAVVAVAGLVG